MEKKFYKKKKLRKKWKWKNLTWKIEKMEKK